MSDERWERVRDAVKYICVPDALPDLESLASEHEALVREVARLRAGIRDGILDAVDKSGVAYGQGYVRGVEDAAKVCDAEHNRCERAAKAHLEHDDPVHLATLQEERGLVAARLADEVRRLREAMRKVSDIRDSIIGTQSFNWSEHAYPLVAVLDAAGFEGNGYEIARANMGTLIEQRDTAYARGVEDGAADMRERAAAVCEVVYRERVEMADWQGDSAAAKCRDAIAALPTRRTEAPGARR